MKMKYLLDTSINPHPRFTAQMPVGVGSYLV